jgi:acyl-CoA dehydrogenase
MDFSLPEDIEAARELAARILGDKVTHERQRELYKDDTWFDAAAWSALGEAGLLGLALPEADGGAGLGFLALAMLAEESGRVAAPLPVIPSIGVGALAIATHGSDAQKQALLPGLLDGSAVITGALVEPGTTPAQPTLTATEADGGWKLDGSKISVMFAWDAQHFIVPARTGETDITVFIVAADSAGVELVKNATNVAPEARINFAAVAVAEADVLGALSGGSEVVDFMVQRAEALMCLEISGACDASLKLAGEYTQQRVQFDRPIATFQAVSQRVGDSYIDNEAVNLTAWQAAWRISEGLPAEREVAIARYWAAEAGHRVTYAAVHLHGGVGVDRDYPLHRYFLMARHHEMMLGGPSIQLEKIGDALAAEPV